MTVKWMRDSELFSDIDAHGKLVSNEFTRSVLKGSAADAVPYKRRIDYNVSGPISEQRGDPQYKAFCGVMQDIRAYVRTHNHIGEFPRPELDVRVTRYRKTYHSSYTPGALDKAVAQVNDLADSAISDVNNADAILSRHGVETSVETLWARDKIDRARRDKIESLEAQAREMDLPNGGRGISTSSSSREIISEKDRDFLFFDKLGDWLPDMTRITAVEGRRAGWQLAFAGVFVRMVLWAVLIGSVLLIVNFAWGAETPLSAFFARIGTESSITILYALCSVIFLWLAWTSEIDLSIRGVPVSLPVFFYPFLFSAMAAASEMMDAGGSELLSEGMIESIGSSLLWGTVIVLVVNFVLRSDFFSYIGASVVTFGILFFGLAVSSALLYEVATEEQTAFLVLCGVIGVAVLVRHIYDLYCFLRHSSWEDEMLKAVSENALLEYKTLRFLWLWVKNSAKKNRDAYLAAVERELSGLKRKVDEASAYANKKHRKFELKHPEMAPRS